MDLEKHKIALPELPGMIAKAAETDAGFQKILVEMMSNLNRALTADQAAALHSVAANSKADPALEQTRLRADARQRRRPGDGPGGGRAVEGDGEGCADRSFRRF